VLTNVTDRRTDGRQATASPLHCYKHGAVIKTDDKNSMTALVLQTKKYIHGNFQKCRILPKHKKAEKSGA